MSWVSNTSLPCTMHTRPRSNLLSVCLVCVRRVQPDRQSATAVRAQLARNKAQVESARDMGRLKRTGEDEGPRAKRTKTTKTTVASRKRAAIVPTPTHRSAQGHSKPPPPKTRHSSADGRRSPTVAADRSTISSSASTSASVSAPGSGSGSGSGSTPASSSCSRSDDRSNSHEAAREAELKRWCVQLLALGPLTVSGLLKQVEAAYRAKKLSWLPREGSILRAADGIAKEEASGKLAILPERKTEALVEWVHYTSAQRRTLEASRLHAGLLCGVPPAQTSIAEHDGATSASVDHERGGSDANGTSRGAKAKRSKSLAAKEQSVAAAHRTPDTAQVDGDVSEIRAPLVVADHAQYELCKRQFAAKYEAYQRFDASLGENTRYFEQLNTRFDECKDSESRAAIAREMNQQWTERQPDIHRKVMDYRRLHAELARLKQAVNRFVESSDSAA
jgi:hypothetical protein